MPTSKTGTSTTSTGSTSSSSAKQNNVGIIVGVVVGVVALIGIGAGGYIYKTRMNKSDKYGNVDQDVVNPVHDNINGDIKDIEYDDSFGK